MYAMKKSLFSIFNSRFKFNILFFLIRFGIYIKSEIAKMLTYNKISKWRHANKIIQNSKFSIFVFAYYGFWETGL